jgi:hypothetical protein
MLDWQHPGDSNQKKREQKERDTPLLRLLSHLANGSKHFQATRKKHDSVKDTSVHQGAFDPDTFDPGTFDVVELRIELDGEAEKYFGAPSISVLRLAEEAMLLWENYP